MGPLMYRHRPYYTALIAAAVVLVFGMCVSCCLKNRVEIGEANRSTVALVICLTAAISGALVISAFARYTFTHLWKTPDPAFAKKKRQKGRRPGYNKPGRVDS